MLLNMYEGAKLGGILTIVTVRIALETLNAADAHGISM